jgi:carboxypeptidase D
MHNATDTEYYNVDSIMIYDPIISYNVISFDIPATPFADYWQGLFNLNETFRAHIHDKFESCGWKDFMDLALTFPPTGILPTPPAPDGSNLNCDLFDDIAEAAYLVNPCWNIYHISDTCPLLYDVLGHTQGGEVYFARHDVQKAIHAPIGDWGECAAGVLQYDDSPPSGLSVLPAVIEKNQRTILGSGALDYILMTNGTIMAVQNMTFNGGQGFSTPPSDWDDFYVPYHGYVIY